VERGEQPADAARREIAEETGLEDLVLHAPLGTLDWYFRLRGRLIHKYCHFFLFECRRGTAVPQAEEGIQCCEWLPATEALRRVTHDNARALLERAISQVMALPPGDRAEPPGTSTRRSEQPSR
jgi:8-oxo-dGTP pyrophosphatase MutT (NUDIX family)